MKAKDFGLDFERLFMVAMGAQAGLKHSSSLISPKGIVSPTLLSTPLQAAAENHNELSRR